MIVVIVIIFLLIIVIWLVFVRISNFHSWEQMSNNRSLGGKSFVGAAKPT